MKIHNTLENYLSMYNQHARNIWQQFDDDELAMLTRIFDRYTKVVDDFLIHVLRTRDLQKALAEWLYIISDSKVDWYYNVVVDGAYINYKF